ncbi:MAG: tetratricopeptide repeat protein [Beijerinckiaceae bacterium]
MQFILSNHEDERYSARVLAAVLVALFAFFLSTPTFSAPKEHIAPVQKNPSALSPWKACVDGKGEAALAACRRLGASGSGFSLTDRAIALAIAGDLLLDAKKVEAAISSYDKALTLNPVMTSAHYMRGRALVEFKQEVEALAAYDKALTLNPNAVQVLLYRARLYRARVAYALAHADLDRALRLDPRNFEIPFERARLFYKEKRWQDSIEQSGIALALNPLETSSYYNRAGSRWEAGEKEGALFDISAYLRNNPDAQDGLQRRSFYLRDMKRFQEALPDAERLLKLFPKDGWSWYNMALVQEKLDDITARPKAFEFYDQAIKLEPRKANYRFDKIDTLINIGMYNEAASALLTVKKLFPDDMRTDRERGRLFVLQGDLPAAREALAAANKLNADDNDLIYWSAREAYRSARYEEALEKLETVRRNTPDFEMAIYYLAMSKRWLRRHKEAIVDFDAYITLAPKDPDGYLGKGIALYRLAEYKPAQQQFELGLEIQPAGKLLRHWLMDSLIQSRQFKAAEKQFEEIETRNLMDDWSRGMKLHLFNTTGRWKQTIEAVNALLPENKMTIQARFEYGRALVMTKKVDDALKEYQAVIQDGSSQYYTAYSHANVGELLFMRHEFVKAREHFEAAMVVYATASDIPRRFYAAIQRAKAY